ncbi:methylated-DNA--[protein]-cysteine S-methyltransferase [Companilactobacillus alimentarius]|uniref:methylated-DNA--[protein]-cysteine S-methyltransferase n=1 Tax=Companilactobacillus alimentarius TaxID=1602 RepID=UPI0006F0084D|nr:methylated-DNA--[protein]-cysteine S-methyltransferase [Companilactobacillus alimentarius]KRK75283.1 methylated DNA-protein cysteine methyltransferase [Companilactobacillus alimentarius DSM 20249]GEO43938.1 methylated-DNA--protein-cysteine methyltransferase, inducible [Companilactobacillus alimentarius]
MSIYFHSYFIRQHYYVIGASKDGLVFVGSQDKGFEELKRIYPSGKIIDDNGRTQFYAQQIEEYLAGCRKDFDIPIDVNGTTFQKSVWKELLKIPYGQTRTYTQIAEAINRPTAIRAVATAIGKNPLLIVIPCHRVVAKSRKLGGYRGGLTMKRELLQLESDK